MTVALEESNYCNYNSWHVYTEQTQFCFLSRQVQAIYSHLKHDEDTKKGVLFILCLKN